MWHVSIMWLGTLTKQWLINTFVLRCNCVLISSMYVKFNLWVTYSPTFIDFERLKVKIMTLSFTILPLRVSCRGATIHNLGVSIYLVLGDIEN